MSGALLAFELAGSQCSVALERDGAPATERTFAAAAGRGLISEADALLRAAGCARADLRGVIAGTGPGSYTGLRIACAAARALADALGIPAGGVCSFEAAALLAPVGADVHVLLDAFRGEVYHARYARTAADVRILTAPRVLSPAEAAAAVPPGALVIGDARFAAADVEVLAPAAAPPAALLLARARQRGARHDGAGVAALGPAEPLYLRPAAFRRPE